MQLRHELIQKTPTVKSLNISRTKSQNLNVSHLVFAESIEARW